MSQAGAGASVKPCKRCGRRLASTVVMPEHRSLGLSRALKVLSHTRLPASAPHIRQIITMNSAVNPAMIKVNEELGYRPVWEEICYQN